MYIKKRTDQIFFIMATKTESDLAFQFLEHAGIDLLSYRMGKPTGRMLLWNTDKVSSPQGLSIHHNLESI